MFILVTLKIRDQKIILPKLYFRQYYMTRKRDVQGSFCGLRILNRFLPDPDPGDPKRPDPTTSGFATILKITLLLESLKCA